METFGSRNINLFRMNMEKDNRRAFIQITGETYKPPMLTVKMNIASLDGDKLSPQEPVTVEFLSQRFRVTTSDTGLREGVELDFVCIKQSVRERLRAWVDGGGADIFVCDYVSPVLRQEIDADKEKIQEQIEEIDEANDMRNEYFLEMIGLEEAQLSSQLREERQKADLKSMEEQLSKANAQIQAEKGFNRQLKAVFDELDQSHARLKNKLRDKETALEKTGADLVRVQSEAVALEAKAEAELSEALTTYAAYQTERNRNHELQIQVEHQKKILEEAYYALVSYYCISIWEKIMFVLNAWPNNYDQERQNNIRREIRNNWNK